MSSLLEQASVIITPNAYKEGKLYGLKGTDLDVVRATTATRVNAEGLIESVANNVPRLDYTNGSCPSILVEPQRTNLALRSEEFDNASWTKADVTVTANTIISPDGTLNADTVIENVGLSLSKRILPTIAFMGTGSLNYSFSVYVKKIANEPTRHIYWMCQRSGDAIFAHFNMDLYTVNQVSSNGSGSGSTASITLVGNDWYRLTLSGIVSTIDGSYFNQFYLEDTPRTGFSPQSYIGNGTSGFNLYGWQAEAGSNATSYIPTVASAVTRNADVISKTGIADLIGQTEGTLFIEADIQKLNENNFYIGISNGASLGEAIYLSQPSGGNLSVLFRTAGLTPTITILSANWNIGYNKIAIAYNQTLGEVFINGVSKGTVALTALPTCNRIVIGSRLDNPGTLVGKGGYKSALLFKTRLSNDELATLTTL